VQKAMQGDQASIAQLLAGDPAAAIGRMDQQKRYSVEDALAETQFGLQERGVDLNERGLEYDMMDGDRQFGLSTEQFNEGRRQFDQGYNLDAELGRSGLAMDRERLAIARQAAIAPPDREIRADANGVPRYVDTQEPVFPDVNTAPKPLIGAESMGRVAAGLPNMRQAVTDLKSALGVNIQDGTATTVEGGYRPDEDWGALALDAFPVVGDVMARGAGGEDYQKFDNAYSTFEAAALPIMSGAAVTDSEAKRALKALRVRVGDTDEAVARKMANMDRMVTGLEAAARGDTAALQSIVGVVNSGQSGGGNAGLPPGFVVIE
jgi:hypothetical protein